MVSEMMLSGRRIACFLVLFALVYGLLMAPWPGLTHAVRGVLIADNGGQWVFNAFFPRAQVKLEAKESKGLEDTRISVRHQATGGRIWMDVNSRQVAFLPVVVVTSLIVATPLGWLRRIWALCQGWALVGVFLVLRLLTMVVYGAYQTLPTPEAVPPTLWDKSVATTVMFVGVGQPMSYIVPILIWGLVTLRGSGLDYIVSGNRPPAVVNEQEAGPKAG